MANLVGQQLGKYRLTHFLGQGGFAEVYLGEHIHLDTLSAIKILSNRLAHEEVQDFLSEARTIANLEHPHIVRILDFDVHEGIAFLVMNYAPNGTLRQQHPKGSRLPLTTIVDYVQQVADALQYAHDHKLIHRDIKPENMLLGRQNEVLLSDFGIALVAQSSSLQSTQDVIGTVQYMAPEHLQGKARRASDQYSLGIVVYEWLCGERPFHGSFTEIYSQHLFVPPAPLHEKMPTIIPAIEQVVQTALAKDPKERFANIKAFATALEQACQVATIRPIALSSEPSIPDWPRPSHDEVETILPLQMPQVASVTASPDQVSRLITRNTSFLAPPPSKQKLLPSSKPQLFQRYTTRRTLMLSLTGLALAGGGISLLAIFQRSRIPSLSFRPTTSTTSTQIPSPTPSFAPTSSTSFFGNTLLIYRGHSDGVRGVAWSPKGKYLASASVDKTVKVWDTVSGNTIYTYRGHSQFVNTAAWSPDGTRIASASGDTTVQVWNATTGKNVLTYRGHSQSQYADVRAIAWSADGKQIAAASDDTTVQVFDASSGNTIYTYRGHADGVYAVAWSPDGTRIASGGGKINTGNGDTAIHVWDATTGKDVLIYHGPSVEVAAIAWSPNSKRIASANIDKTVNVFDATSGNTIYTYHGHRYAVEGTAWSPDGTRIASAGVDWTVQVWNAADGSHALTYRGHAKSVNAVAWSPDGTRIASASDDKTVQIWQATL